MVLYAIRRVGLALVIVLCAMAVLFGMIHLVPGDPITIALGPRATEAMRQAYLAKMRLDQPVHLQLLAFAGGVLRGDLGADVFSNRSVATIVLEQLPHTLALAGAGLGWAVLLGIPLGCYSAIRRNSLFDKVSGVITVGAIAVPSFVVALYALLVFAVWLRWLPAIGAGEQGDLGDQLLHLILPAFAIGLGWVGYLARLVRASMLEVMGENHSAPHAPSACRST